MKGRNGAQSVTNELAIPLSFSDQPRKCCLRDHPEASQTDSRGHPTQAGTQGLSLRGRAPGGDCEKGVVGIKKRFVSESLTELMPATASFLREEPTSVVCLLCAEPSTVHNTLLF